jgi:two-component system NtrC family sensor kinase
MSIVRLNLQWRVLLLVAGAMTAILVVSLYLHGSITRSLIEEDHYNYAVSQTVALAGRITAREMFSDNVELQRSITHAVSSHPDFKQIDVYHSTVDGLHLEASTAPGEQRLRVMNEDTPDNELGEIERPLPGVVSIETVQGGRRYWLISVAIKDRNGEANLSALVFKNPGNALVSSLTRQYNLVMSGAILASVALLYLLFAYFFRRPARDIVQAMASARAGDLSARIAVQRDDELGEIARGFNCMIDDIRERAGEREELLARVSGFNDELRREVAAATKDLRAADDALFNAHQGLARGEKLAAIGQVAASLAHEIGTPLNAIGGHLHLLARSHAHDADTQRRVQVINKQLDFIVFIVRRLLQRTHHRRAVRQPLDLNALVRETLRLVAPMLEAHAIAFAESLDPELPLVSADRDQLPQVLLNLINNSIDAMPHGGRLEVSTHCDGQARVATLKFRDTGCGIAPDAVEHLFEPLYTTKETGSGFGLAIVREIMKEHDGTIELLADQPEGAAFRLTLPLAAVASESATSLHSRNQEVTSDVA